MALHGTAAGANAPARGAHGRDAPALAKLRTPGLHTRLVGVTLLVAGGFLTAVGWVLDRSFHVAMLASAEDELRSVAYSLLAGAVESPDGPRFAVRQQDPRLTRPEGGLYAFARGADGSAVWKSISLQVAAPGWDQVPATPGPGEATFRLVPGSRDEAAPGLAGPGGRERLVLGYTVIWEAANDLQVTLWVIEDSADFRAQIRDYRVGIAFALAGAALVFVTIQLLALRWGLRPVRVMADRVRALERGESVADRDGQGIGVDYPRELVPLARNLNRFVAHERESRARYRRAMDDLAHSLKTPLAVLRNAFRDVASASPGLLGEQVDRMEAAVTHQLSRAATSRVTPAAPQPIAPTVSRLARALSRARPDKPVELDIDADGVRVPVDEGDLMEMLGNLLENAYKYSRSRIRVGARRHGDAVTIRIEDDGPGIAPEHRRVVLERGARADTATPGHGIGLAVVVEIASIYGGRFDIGSSPLGGAAVELELPAATG